MLAGDTYSLSRLITLIEKEGPEVNQIMDLIPANPPKTTYRIGITGPRSANVIKPVIITQARDDIGIEELYRELEKCRHK